MSTNAPTRRKPVSQAAGYAVAAAIDAVLLYLINVHPGWQAVPFLTGDTATVLVLINASLVVGLAANVASLVHPAPWLVAAGGVVTTAVGLAALIGLWRVFPFDFADMSAWHLVVRVLLVLGIVGSGVGILVQVGQLARTRR